MVYIHLEGVTCTECGRRHLSLDEVRRWNPSNGHDYRWVCTVCYDFLNELRLADERGDADEVYALVTLHTIRWARAIEEGESDA